MIATIGPVWDGNEVWLLAAGGTLYFAFPALYASGFSGFYLPLMIVLWLLILRGTAVEFRNHVQSPIWIPFWDFVFSHRPACCWRYSSAPHLAMLCAGCRWMRPATSSNRSGPISASAQHTGILDWFTILVGVQALLALMMHGGLWVQLKTHGAVSERAGNVAGMVWWGVLVMTAVVTGATFVLQPQVIANFHTWPAGYVLPLLAVAGFATIKFELHRKNERNAFLASCTYFLGMLTSVVFGVYPMVLPARNPAFSLTVQNAKAADYGLKIGLIWWVIGMALATVYFVYVYRSFAGKVPEAPDSPSHGD